LAEKLKNLWPRISLSFDSIVQQGSSLEKSFLVQAITMESIISKELSVKSAEAVSSVAVASSSPPTELYPSPESVKMGAMSTQELRKLCFLHLSDGHNDLALPSFGVAGAVELAAPANVPAEAATTATTTTTTTTTTASFKHSEFVVGGQRTEPCVLTRSTDAVVTVSSSSSASSTTSDFQLSSSSSTCTRESTGTLSDAESNVAISSSAASTPVATKRPLLEREFSASINAKVSIRKTSRQGRSSQRWVTDHVSAPAEHEGSIADVTTISSVLPPSPLLPATNNVEKSMQDPLPTSTEAIRLVTGCVPLLKNGNVLLISSMRKPEWILPKGGWESDELMEESAIRESYEEAGILGTLGPRLSTIQYETRKSKKRRLEQGKQVGEMTSSADAQGSGSATTEAADDRDVDSTNNTRLNSTSSEMHYGSTSDGMTSSDDLPTSIASSESYSKVKVGGCTSMYSQVRMTLFPLYVSQILNEWPEQGRIRKAVSIDEAIAILERRPEFQRVLLEVKEKGLHLIPDVKTIPSVTLS
jgi:hypothetical protein